MRTLGSKNRTPSEAKRLRRNQRNRIRRKALFASLRARGLVSTKYRFGQPRIYAIHDQETRRNNTYYKIYNQNRMAQGLTCAGKPRKQHRHNLPRANDLQTRRANNSARMRHYAQINLAKGLTASGKPRKRGIFSPLETAWREFRSTIQIPEPPDLCTWADRAA